MVPAPLPNFQPYSAVLLLLLLLLILLEKEEEEEEEEEEEGEKREKEGSSCFDLFSWKLSLKQKAKSTKRK